MRYNPSDWNKYTQKQKEEFYGKSFEEKRKIVNQSHLSLITDETGNLDTLKILELIMDLQDRVDDLETECVRKDYY